MMIEVVVKLLVMTMMMVVVVVVVEGCGVVKVAVVMR